ncbi:hypothetical protein LUZ60_014330 [Juncus effusus]|nr:hypothetical protein LUZ60_014330 [Juncus effusus]
MAVNLDKVFVQLSYYPNGIMPTLEWTLDYFDSDKIKIILIPYGADINVDQFLDVSRSIYLPRCAQKKFRAEILLPEAYGQYKASILELIIKHGMNKFVADTRGSTLSKSSKVFEEESNLSCKIWYVNHTDVKLVATRCYNFCNAEMIAAEALLENEKLKNMNKEENSRRENVEKELLSMIEQTKMNKQEIDRLLQEIDELKQNKALSTTFTFQNLEQATQNFNDSLKIGEGQSKCVYKGIFRGTVVAIKIFKSQSKPSLPLSQQEVVILGTIRHPNLVNFMGACSEPPALVYEFISGKSLLNYLNHQGNTMPLPWDIRIRIIGDICAALIFLHSNKPNPIIHGDLRPDNILLDANFTRKLSDFGLIKQVDTNITNSDPTRTLAYIDPEYFTTEEITLESDVYSFGIFILHLLTGKSHLNISKIVEETIKNDNLCTIIDESAGEWPLHHAEELAKIGIWCVDALRSERPDLINEVWPIVERLVKFADEIMIGPTSSVQHYRHERSESLDQLSGVSEGGFVATNGNAHTTPIFYDCED